MTLKSGLESRKTLAVGIEDLALHWGSDMPVLATPVLIGLFEKTCVSATDEFLPEGSTTVGMGVDILHISPTPQGGEIEILARLDEVNGKKLTFHVEAYDAFGIVSTGTLYRMVVTKTSFLTKVLRKTNQAGNATPNGEGPAARHTAA